MTKEIENKVKNTVGYMEASNKESFMTGAQVGYGKSAEIFEAKIKELEVNVLYWRNSYEAVRTDITNVATILYNYITNEE